MISIGLITPTFNRLNEIKRLAESLVLQASNISEWVIIDDGSFDGTYQWCLQFAHDAKFPVIVLRQGNTGKSQAVKIALEMVSTDFVGIIDSDDELTSDALESLKYHIEKYPNYTSYIGFCKGSNPSIRLGSFSWEEILNQTNLELWGIHRTTELKKFDFAPYYPKERFNPEYNVWGRLNFEKNIYYVNYPLRVYHREASKLSRRMWAHIIRNPRSYKDYFDQKLSIGNLSLYRKIRYSLLRKLTKTIINVID